MYGWLVPIVQYSALVVLVLVAARWLYRRWEAGIKAAAQRDVAEEGAHALSDFQEAERDARDTPRDELLAELRREAGPRDVDP